VYRRGAMSPRACGPEVERRISVFRRRCFDGGAGADRAVYRRRASSPNEYGNRCAEAHVGLPLQGTAPAGSARRASADASESSVSIDVTVRVSGSGSTAAMWRALRYTAAGAEADGRSVTDLERRTSVFRRRRHPPRVGLSKQSQVGTVLGVRSSVGSGVVGEP
jgi:hypothetical protein